MITKDDRASDDRTRAGFATRSCVGRSGAALLGRGFLAREAFGHHLAGAQHVAAPDLGGSGASEVQEEKEDLLVELANRAVAETEADVVIFSGAPLAGLAERVKARIPVPVVDQVQAATKQIEALIALRPRKPVAGTFRRPPAKPTTGLPAPLARRIEHGDD